MRELEEIDGYDLLAIEVCRVAAEDYRWFKKALSGRWHEKDLARIRQKMNDIEWFFESEYGNVFCYGLGLFILRRLKEEKPKTKNKHMLGKDEF